MNWGARIILAYFGFMAIIAAMVTISMKQDVYLVEKDYYKQEIAYQDQIERIENNRSLGEKGLKLTHVTQPNRLKLYPPEGRSITAELLFFRPSDASKDKKYEVILKDAHWKNLTLDDFEKGLWKLKVNWKDGGKSYYMEKTLVL